MKELIMKKTADECVVMLSHLTPVPRNLRGVVSGKLPCICNDTGYVELSYAPGKKVPCGFCNKK